MYIHVHNSLHLHNYTIDIIDIHNRDWKRRVLHQLARTFSVGAEVASWFKNYDYTHVHVHNVGHWYDIHTSPATPPHEQSLTHVHVHVHVHACPLATCTLYMYMYLVQSSCSLFLCPCLLHSQLVAGEGAGGGRVWGREGGRLGEGTGVCWGRRVGLWNCQAAVAHGHTRDEGCWWLWRRWDSVWGRNGYWLFPQCACDSVRGGGEGVRLHGERRQPTLK